MNATVWVQALTLGSAMATLGIALTAGPLRIFSRASGKFALFNAFVLLASLCWWPWGALSTVPPLYRLALGLVLFLAALQWLCGGLQTLHDLKPTYALSPLMWPALAILMAVMAWLDSAGKGAGTALWLAFFSACLWILSVSLHQAVPSLMAQGGVQVGRWSLAPLVLAGLMWLAGMGCALVVMLRGPNAVAWDWQWVLLVASWGLLNGGLVGLLMLKLVDKIRELNTEDERTGALNMRGFMALLNAERDRLRRTPQAQSLLLIEVDQYHNLNKQLGFAAGDAALRHVTIVLGRGLRKTDRLGSSLNAELLMFLPATPTMGAMLVAERTQASMKAHPFLWNGQAINLTLSIGVAGREDEAMPSETLLDFCGQAVRRAQREGGGRIRTTQFDSQGPDAAVSDSVSASHTRY